MEINVDKTYKKVPLSGLSTLYMDSTTFSGLFFEHLSNSFGYIIGMILMGLVANLFPTKYTNVGQPSSVNEYFTNFLKVGFFIITLFLLVNVFATLVEIIRLRIDKKAGYKKVGNFQVGKIINRGYYKIIKLTGGYSLKIQNTDLDFNKITVGDIIKIERTATNKLLSFKRIAV